MRPGEFLFMKMPADEDVEEEELVVLLRALSPLWKLFWEWWGKMTEEVSFVSSASGSVAVASKRWESLKGWPAE